MSKDVHQHAGNISAVAAQSKPLVQYVTEKLVTKFSGSGRNITADNWLTSVSLLKSLRENYGLTYAGTLRQNKQKIPLQMLNKKNLLSGQSAFGFSADITLVTFASATSKTKKSWCIFCRQCMISHWSLTIESPKLFCVTTPQKVDTFDQMCAFQSCSRMTKRWPLTFFYGMLNASCVNAYILYKEHQPQNILSRLLFQKHLVLNMIKPLAQRRLSLQNLPFAVRSIVRTTFPGLTSSGPSECNKLLETRQRCKSCPPSKRNKTRFTGQRCGEPVCIDHFQVFCKECWQVSVCM